MGRPQKGLSLSSNASAGKGRGHRGYEQFSRDGGTEAIGRRTIGTAREIGRGASGVGRAEVLPARRRSGNERHAAVSNGREDCGLGWGLAAGWWRMAELR